MNAFQSGAFQASAFQLTLAAAVAAFQPSAFQNDAFQTDEAAVVPAASTATPGRHGQYQGPAQRHRTEQERYQRRVELGILPPPVKKAVEKAARRVINKAQAEQTPERQINPLEWLSAHHAQEQQALAHELRKRELGFEIRYMALVRFEVERRVQEQAQIAQQAEEEQILALLLEM